MRTTAEENRQLGAEIAKKANAATGSVAIFLPLAGMSAIDKEGQPFDDPEARGALFDAVRRNRGDTELVELPHHINDTEFAEAAARRLLELIEAQPT